MRHSGVASWWNSRIFKPRPKPNGFLYLVSFGKKRPTDFTQQFVEFSKQAEFLDTLESGSLNYVIEGLGTWLTLLGSWKKSLSGALFHCNFALEVELLNPRKCIIKSSDTTSVDLFSTGKESGRKAVLIIRTHWNGSLGSGNIVEKSIRSTWPLKR